MDTKTEQNRNDLIKLKEALPILESEMYRVLMVESICPEYVKALEEMVRRVTQGIRKLETLLA